MLQLHFGLDCNNIAIQHHYWLYRPQSCPQYQGVFADVTLNPPPAPVSRQVLQGSIRRIENTHYTTLGSTVDLSLYLSCSLHHTRYWPH